MLFWSQVSAVGKKRTLAISLALGAEKAHLNRLCSTGVLLGLTKQQQLHTEEHISRMFCGGLNVIIRV